MAALTEQTAGVRPVGAALEALLRWVRPTFTNAAGAVPCLPIGYFANVVPVSDTLGIAISTDGVGTKLLIAQSVGRFDSVGIDCVAMNVNDVLCVGARPVALVDYVALEEATSELLGALGEGLAHGCSEAGVSCPGGELAQVREMLRGAAPGKAVDLVGTAIGVVPLDRILAGQAVEAGDVLLGLESTGLHSNGYTLARRVLLEQGRLSLDAYIDDLGCILGEELLRPTRIYVKPILDVLGHDLAVHALAHHTGDGLFNLVRTVKPIGFDIEHWPTPPPIFGLLQRLGGIADAEMFRAFNMGIGFSLVVARSAADAARSVLEAHGLKVHVLGRATDDSTRTINFRPRGLIGQNGSFAGP